MITYWKPQQKNAKEMKAELEAAGITVDLEEHNGCPFLTWNNMDSETIDYIKATPIGPNDDYWAVSDKGKAIFLKKDEVIEHIKSNAVPQEEESELEWG
jgi:hypothetical protein